MHSVSFALLPCETMLQHAALPVVFAVLLQGFAWAANEL